LTSSFKVHFGWVYPNKNINKFISWKTILFKLEHGCHLVMSHGELKGYVNYVYILYPCYI